MRGKQGLAADPLRVGRRRVGEEPRRSNEAGAGRPLSAGVEEIGQHYRVGVIVAALVANRLGVLVGRGLADDMPMHHLAIASRMHMRIRQQAHQRDRESGNDCGDARGPGKRHDVVSMSALAGQSQFTAEPESAPCLIR